MKIIVDANIVFSGILNSNGKIGDLLMNLPVILIPKTSYISPMPNSLNATCGQAIKN